MLGLHNELIGVARVLVVVDQAGDEGAQEIVALQALDHITIAHQIVQPLHAVENVRYAMVRILFEVAHLELSRQRCKVLQWNVERIEEAVVLEDLESQELKGCLVEHSLETNRIELDLVQVLSGLIVELAGELLQLDNLHELLLKRVDYGHELPVSIYVLRLIFRSPLLSHLSLQSVFRARGLSNLLLLLLLLVLSLEGG